MNTINSGALPRLCGPRSRDGISWPESVVIIIVITLAAVLAVLGMPPAGTALTLSAGGWAALHLLVRLRGVSLRSPR